MVNEDHGEEYARAAVQWREGGEAQHMFMGQGLLSRQYLVENST